MRLDVYLHSKNLSSSRSAAKDAIKEGRVQVNSQTVLKVSYLVVEGDHVTIAEGEYTFASRGGIKLYEALNVFNIDLKNKNVLDVGASTGGFSDVCLQQGANHVYALDVGVDQLIDRLKNDTRITNMENVNAREIQKDMFDLPLHFVCMDVSFISITLLMEHILNVLDKNFDCVILIKPQFEVGKQFVNKNGIVKDNKIHIRLLKDMIAYFNDLGLGVKHLSKSKIKGRGGNQEYLIHLSEVPNTKHFKVDEIVKERG